MKWKTLLLSTLFVVGFIVPSCNFGNDCDFDPVPNFFDIGGMSLTNHQAERVYKCCFNELKDSSSVALDEYWISMDFAVSYFFGQIEKLDDMYEFDFMNSALACSPPERGENGSKEKIKNITVITLNDFDDAHPAGDTINEFIYVYVAENKVDLNQFLNNNISFVKRENMVFQLKSLPVAESYFKAKIVLMLDNGEEYTAETNDIVLY